MLPSDFAGPPASAIRGDVLAPAGSSKDAERPRLSLEWLAGMAPREPGVTSLIGQGLSYQRSVKLQNDWDIGLGLPAEAAKFDSLVAARRVRLGVAKMVYFDDRTGDGRLDWGCRGSACDQVKAVSSEFVLFIESPPYCQGKDGMTARPRLSPGYHYFRFADGQLRELGASEAMSFHLIDRAPVDSDPTPDLDRFVAALLRSWALAAIEGC